jgi:4-hydroxybenzoate polyprenyltransferase
MRPAQWVKNLFVLAPVLFAKAHTAADPSLLAMAALATAVFVLLSGAVYVMNDVLDVEKDRLHPVRKNRPIASGAITVQAAVAGGLVALAAAFAAGSVLGPEFAVVATGYLVLNVFYSSALKKVAWLDVLSIATGFLLRILGGCFAIGLAPREISYYLIACTFLVALFLAVGKRRHELAVLGDASFTRRSALRGYRGSHLDLALRGVAALTVATYALYAISPRTQAYFFPGRPETLLGSWRMVFTVPFVVAGIVRYVQLLGRTGEQRSPTDTMIRDVPFVVNIGLWVATAVWAIYG